MLEGVGGWVERVKDGWCGGCWSGIELGNRDGERYTHTHTHTHKRARARAQLIKLIKKENKLA